MTAPLAVTTMLFLLIASRSALAQPAPSGAGEPSALLSLETAIAEALAQSPVIEAAGAQDRAAHWKATAAARARFGQIDAVASYSRLQDDQTIRPIARQLFGPAGFMGLPWDRDQVHYGVTFQVPLYTGGRLAANMRVTELQAEQAALVTEGTRWDVQANVASLYAARQTLDAVAVALTRSIEALDVTGRRVSLMVEHGKRPRLDLLKLEEEVQEARSRQSATDADRTRVSALLLAAMGRDPRTPITVTPLPDYTPVLTLTTDALTALARAASPVRRADLAAEQAGVAVKAARATRFPAVALRGNLFSNVGLGIGEQAATWDLSVAVTVPLFDGGARAAEVRSAQESWATSTALARRAHLDHDARVVDAVARVTSTRASLTAAQARVAAADEAARIEQIRYDVGAGTVEDLLRVRAREFAAASALAQARGDVMSAVARLNAVCETEVAR